MERFRLGVTSALTHVEAHRALDRLWHYDHLSEDDLAEKRASLGTFLPRLERIGIGEAVMQLASASLPIPLRSLDAIHLATAMIYRRTQPPDERPLLFATHDRQLAKAAAAMQFDVIGAAA
jgi:predicted nucleic acid-binding protein